jgi:hypothetical protein
VDEVERFTWDIQKLPRTGSFFNVSALFAMGKNGRKTAFIDRVVRVAKGGKQR